MRGGCLYVGDFGWGRCGSIEPGTKRLPRLTRIGIKASPIGARANQFGRCRRVARRQRFTACELISCGKWRRAWRPQNKVIIRRALIVSLDMATSASRAKKIVQTLRNQPSPRRHFARFRLDGGSIRAQSRDDAGQSAWRRRQTTPTGSWPRCRNAQFRQG